PVAQAYEFWLAWSRRTEISMLVTMRWYPEGPTPDYTQWCAIAESAFWSLLLLIVGWQRTFARAAIRAESDGASRVRATMIARSVADTNLSQHITPYSPFLLYEFPISLVRHGTKLILLEVTEDV